MNFITKSNMEIFIFLDVAYTREDEGRIEVYVDEDDEYSGRMNQTRDARKYSAADYALKGPFLLPSNFWYFGLRTKSRKELLLNQPLPVAKK